MLKYRSELKLEIVELLHKGKISVAEASEKYGVHKSDIQKWVAKYSYHGVAGLERERMTYTGEFKQQVIEDMRKNHLSLRETAAKYNIAIHTTISSWERIYLEEGPQGLYIERRGRASKASSTTQGRPSKMDREVEQDLIAENQRLRMENAYLKKLNALVQEQEKSQTETKRK